MAELSVVGKRVPMVDAFEKVTGKALYAGDISLPGTLHGKILRSPYPHANILRIDTNKAKALPGVHAVLTRADMPELHGESPTNLIIAKDKVRFVGEGVAAVAAVDVETAWEALGLIEVEYEELPAVLDAEAAVQPSAPQLYPEGNRVQGFMGNPMKREKGYVDQGFAEAEYVFEQSYKTEKAMNACPDLKCTVCRWEGDHLTVWATSQGPFADRNEIAEALGIPQSKIRFICPYAGGGYGSSNKSRGSGDYRVICAMLAKMTGRPVRIEFTRAEEILVGQGRCSFNGKVKIGARRDGTITAIDTKLFYDVGAYDHSGYLTAKTGGEYSFFGAYERPCRYEADIVFTNTPQGEEFRGFGGPSHVFPLETAVDELAYELGVDPLEIRFKNHVVAPSLYGTGPQILPTAACEEVLTKGAEAIGWKEKWHKPGEGPLTDGTKKRGVGVAMYAKGGGLMFTYALIRVNPDGSVHVLEGAANMGVAANTTQAQVVAEVLGVPFEDVHVVFGDTDVVAFDNATNASRTALGGGNAHKLAALDAKRQILELAIAPRVTFAGVNYLFEENTQPSELDIKDGRVFLKATPDKSVSIAEAIAPKTITGRGYWDLDDSRTWPAEDVERIRELAKVVKEKADRLGWQYEISEYPLARPMQTGAIFSEVEVDIETGEVKVVKVVIAADVGKAINPNVVEGQLHGGYLMCMGYGLYESIIVDPPTGIPLNLSWLDYKIAGALDAPEFEAIIVEVPNPMGAFGINILGEATTLAPAPSLGNAIFNATGVRIRELPLTPDKILVGLQAT